MALDTSPRRLPLRDLITDAEKHTRNLLAHVQTTVLPQVGELHDLSRPQRKKKHAPTLGSLKNALERLAMIDQNTVDLVDHLLQELGEISKRARQECSHRH